MSIGRTPASTFEGETAIYGSLEMPNLGESAVSGKPRNTIVSIQWLRALAAISVVAFHADRNSVTEAGAAGVDLFFVISGFIMWMTTANTAIAPWEFMRRRLIRICPTYWFFTTLLLIAALVAPTLFRQLKLEWPHVVASYLFIPWPTPWDGMIAPLLIPGWTLQYEMLFYCIFAVSLGLPIAERAKTVTLVLISLAAFGFLFQPRGPVLKTLTGPEMVQFAAGIWIAKAWLGGWIRLSPRVASAIIAFAIGTLIAKSTLGIKLHERLGVLVVGALASAIVVAALALESHMARWPSIGRLLGDASYSIYLVHTLVISTCLKLYALLGLSSPVAGLAFTIATIVLTTLVGAISYRLIERPTLRLLR